MTLETKTITPETVVGEVQALKNKGYRFVTMTCLDLDADTCEIMYHFDKDLELVHLRMTGIAKGSTVPSISQQLFAAFLVENEIRDQYGLCFEGLVLDFGGTLYLEDDVRRTPFCKYTITEKTSAEG